MVTPLEDGLPGFGIAYPWSRLRFVRMPVSHDGATRGKLTVLKHGYDTKLEAQWSPVDSFFFNVNGNISTPREAQE